MQRNLRIDLIRGWLILLVIIGHIVLGSVHYNEVRYLIYAFHMPVFIGLSGYLINQNGLKKTGLIDLSLRYWWRVLFPFAFAFVFFCGILWLHAIQEGRFEASMVVGHFITPYYHLWFIPTLVMWVVGLWSVLKFRLPLTYVGAFFVLISLIWASVAKADMPSLASALFSKKVIYFYGFFLFGALLRAGKLNSLLKTARDFKVLPAAVILLCAIIYLFGIGPDKEPIKGIAWLLLNLGLILVCVAWMSARQKTEPYKQWQQVLVTMGRISLPIYLWHMVPMFLLKGYDVHQTQPLLYYAVSILGTAIIVALLITLEGKSKLLNKTFYGI